MSNEAEFENLAAKHAADEKFKQHERAELAALAKKHKLSSLDVNLAYSRAAIRFVRREVPIVGNDDIYQPGSYDYEALAGRHDLSKQNDADLCVNETLRKHKDYKKLPNIRNVSDDKRRDVIEKVRDQAVAKDCGNCYEMSSVAFMHFFRLGLRPIDVMSILPLALDHTFVVLGRTKDTEDWTAWGPSAVICDPWAVRLRRATYRNATGAPFGDSFGAYPATQLRQKMTEMFPRFTGAALEHSEA